MNYIIILLVIILAVALLRYFLIPGMEKTEQSGESNNKHVVEEALKTADSMHEKSIEKNNAQGIAKMLVKSSLPYHESADKETIERVRQYLEIERIEAEVSAAEEMSKYNTEEPRDLSDEEVALLEMENLEPKIDPSIEEELQRIRQREEENAF